MTADPQAQIATITAAASSSEVAPAASSLPFSLPSDPATLAQLARLSDRARRNLSRTLLALRNIHTATLGARPSPLTQAIRAEAARCQHQPGFTFGTLRRKYYAYVNGGGDWRSILDKSLAGPAYQNTGLKRSLPEAFLEFWKQLCERNQRKSKPAHRELLRILRTGHDTERREYKEIPGYGNRLALLESGPTGEVPAGWSYENLMRHAPEPFALTAMRQGRFAARVHTRQVYTSRVGVPVGAIYMFDDQEYDHKVNFPGSSKAIRPLGFNALDFASACFFANAFKPTQINEDGTKTKLKTKTDFAYFLAEVLATTGYCSPQGPQKNGTILVLEHGTATISDDLEQRLFDLTGGAITVERSGIFTTPSCAALFDGAKRGNPRFKAPIESAFNLVRNEFAMLPGQVGLDRDHCPDEHHGRDQYNTMLLKAAAALPPEQAALLRHPFHTWTEFVDLALEIYRRINTRTDHNLEGWRNHTTKELCLDGHWINLAVLSSAGCQPAVSQVANLRTRTRRLSPQEVFNTGARALQPLPLELIPALLGPDLATERTIRGGYITLEDQDHGPDPIRFPVTVSGPTSGQKFATYHLAGRLILADARGRHIATLDQQHIPSRLDTDAIQRQLAAARKEEAARLAQLGVRHADRARERTAMHQHNARVMARQPVTAEQQARANDLADQITAAETSDILGDDNGRAQHRSAGCQPAVSQVANLPTANHAETINLEPDDILTPAAHASEEVARAASTDIDDIL